MRCASCGKDIERFVSMDGLHEQLATTTGFNIAPPSVLRVPVATYKESWTIVVAAVAAVITKLV